MSSRYGSPSQLWLRARGEGTQHDYGASATVTEREQLIILQEAQAFNILLPQGIPHPKQWAFAVEVLRTLPWATEWMLQFRYTPIYLMTGSIIDHPTYGRTPNLRTTPGIGWPAVCISLPAAYPIAPDGSIGHGSFDTIVHELGHWFSRTYNGAWGATYLPPLGYTEEWKRIWSQIAWPMDTHRADPDEALADAFAWMWMTRAGFHLKVPGRIGFGPCPQLAMDYWTKILTEKGWNL